MRGRFALLLLLAGAALAGLVWLAWRANRPARDPLAPEDARALSAPTPEQLAALDSAETRTRDAVEAPPVATRAVMEEHTLRTRAATITVQPPKVASENRGMIIVWCYVESSRASIAPDEIAVVTPDGREIVQKRGKDQDTFRGLAPVLYSVVVRDARFENVRIDSVPTGSHVLVNLLGTASIRPHAVDAETGAALDGSALRFLDFGPKRELAPDAQGWFTGLPFGNFSVRVAAPGYEPAELRAADLAPGEAREVELRFTRAGEIRGLVMGEVDGQPLAHVLVELEFDGARDHLFERLDPRQSALPTSARTNGEGRFSITGLPLREYTVQAYLGFLLKSPALTVKLSEGNRIQEVVLRVPPIASLTGKLVCEAPGGKRPDFDGLLVSIGTTGEGQLTNVLSDGSFLFQNCLPAGRVEVRLMQNRGSLTSRLGELELHTGANECSFDISERLPGDAVIELAAQGVDIDGGTLLVTTLEGGQEIESFDFTGHRAVAGPLLAGEYLVLARGAAQDWMTSTPLRLRIEAGKVVEARLEPRLARGRLALQLAEDQPLPQGTLVRLTRAIPDWPGGGLNAVLHLDEGGLLELELEPGTYALEFITEHPLVWTASGPAEPVLRLAPR